MVLKAVSSKKLLQNYQRIFLLGKPSGKKVVEITPIICICYLKKDVKVHNFFSQITVTFFKDLEKMDIKMISG